MAIAETFFLLFEADASKLKAGLNDAQDQGKQTAQQLSKVDQQAKQLGKSFVGMLKYMARLYIGTRTLQTMKNMTFETAAANAELGKQANALGLGVERLQQWKGAFDSAGSSGDAFVALFEKLQKEVKDPEAHLLNIADTMQRMTEGQAVDYAKSLGLDKEAVGLLRQGKEGIEELLRKEKELGLVTKEDVEQSKQFNEQKRVTNKLFESMRQRIAMSVLPAVKWALEGMQKFIRFLREHEPFAKSLFIGLAFGITALYLPAVLKAAAATFVWLAPFLAIAAVAAGIALIIDDLLVYFRGGDSLIGEWAEKFPIIKTILEGIRGVIEWIGDLLRKFVSSDIENFGTAMTAVLTIVGLLGGKFLWVIGKIVATKSAAFALKGMLDLVGSSGSVAVSGIATNTTKAAKAMRGLGKAIGMAGAAFAAWEAGQAIGGVINTGIDKAITAMTGRDNSLGTWLASKFSGVDEDAIAADMAKGRNIVAQSNNPLATQTSNVTNNSKAATANSNVQVGAVNIQTQATDADGIAKAIPAAIQQQMKGASAQLADGVAA